MQNRIKIPLTRLLLTLLVLISASLACNLPAGEATPPPTQPPLSTEEVQQFEEELKSTLVSPAQPGEITVNITQQQLNSFIIAEMANRPDLPISDPQVVLTNGQMEIYGTVSQSGISANSKIVMRPRIDESGSPKMDIVSVTVGPFPAPDAFRDQIAALVDNALNDYIAASSDKFTVTSITITEGLMTVTGVPQQP